jgi:hypothetical protein
MPQHLRLLQGQDVGLDPVVDQQVVAGLDDAPQPLVQHGQIVQGRLQPVHDFVILVLARPLQLPAELIPLPAQVDVTHLGQCVPIQPVIVDKSPKRLSRTGQVPDNRPAFVEFGVPLAEIPFQPLLDGTTHDPPGLVFQAEGGLGAKGLFQRLAQPGQEGGGTHTVDPGA